VEDGAYGCYRLCHGAYQIRVSRLTGQVHYALYRNMEEGRKVEVCTGPGFGPRPEGRDRQCTNPGQGQMIAIKRYIEHFGLKGPFFFLKETFIRS
jgi:hypothetical protein